MIQNLERYYFYAFLLLVISISLQGIIPVMTNLSLALSGVFFIFLIAKSKSQRQKLFGETSIGIYVLILLYLVIKFHLFSSLLQELDAISKYAIPLAILIQAVLISKKNWQKVFKIFVLGVLISLLISSFNLIHSYQENQTLSLSTGKHIDDLLVGGRVYLSYAVTLASIVCLYFVFTLKTNKRWVYSLLFVVFYLFLLITSARLAIGIVSLIALLFMFKNLKLKQSIIISVAALSLISGMFYFNPNLANRFVYADKQKEMWESFKQWEPRYVIWQCNYELISESTSKFLVGYKTKMDIEDKLMACYPSKIFKNDDKIVYFERERFNSHNQYFDFILFGGVALLLLYFIFLGILSFTFPLNQFGYYILIALLCMFLVENLMHRQSGVYLIGIMLSSIYHLRLSSKD